MMDLSFISGDCHFTYRVAALILHRDHALFVRHNSSACYYTVGGRVHFQESSADAVLREAQEETQTSFTIDRLAFISERCYSYHGSPYHEICFYYLLNSPVGLIIENGQFTDQEPAERLYWLPLCNLSQYDLMPAFLCKRLLQLPDTPEHIID